MEKNINISMDEQYDLFIDQIIENSCIWTLRNTEGFVLFQDNSERNLFPIWASENDVKPFISGEWSDCYAISISLATFEKDWINGLTKDNFLISIFPNDNNDKTSAISITPLEFLEEITSL